jgi:NAD(P)H-flavin reductase
MSDLLTAPSAMLPRFARVVRSRQLTADTFTLWLREDGTASAAPKAFAPGQFNMLGAPGHAEVPISISGDPALSETEHTLRTVGSATRALGRLRRGDWVGVRGPFGTGWPMAGAQQRPLVVVAGGIGLAPLKSVIHSVLSRRHDFGPLVIVYGARTPADLLFQRELEHWASEPDVQVLVTVDRGDPGWTGQTGVVTKLLAQARFDAGSAVCFLCGPEIMMRYCARELGRLGVPQSAIYLSVERNMKCGVGLCGHCQLGPLFVCKDGPVVAYERVRPLLLVPEL